MNPDEVIRFIEKQDRTNDKITESLSHIDSEMSVFHSKLDSIYEQTQKTNGRVTGLEKINNEFDIKYLVMFDEIKEERKKIKNKVFDYVWKVIAIGSLASILGSNVETLIKIIK